MTKNTQHKSSVDGQKLSVLPVQDNVSVVSDTTDGTSSVILELPVCFFAKCVIRYISFSWFLTEDA